MEAIRSPLLWLILWSGVASPFAPPTGQPVSSRLASWTERSGDGWSVADDWNALSAETPGDGVAIFQPTIPQKVEAIVMDREELWLHQVMDGILTTPLSSTPLYDTPTGSGQKTATQEFERRMEDEIARLIRCNQSPDDLLVAAGRGVPELSVGQRDDVSQLLVWREAEGCWEGTPFLHEAVDQIFRTHATRNAPDDPPTMNSKCVGKWMTRCLGAEGNGKSHKIAPHDSRVLRTITQYSTYGTGVLTLENLQRFYLDALTLIPNTNTNIHIQTGNMELLQLRNSEKIRQVWRDFANHGIVGPIEQQWKQDLQKHQETFGTQTQRLLESREEFMDECEILDYADQGPPPTAEQLEWGYDAKNHKYIKKSSHEQIKLAKDGKTPLYMEEGSFVFIDEESCIGCMQCVNVAPDSFLMLENGRARTFQQRWGGDVRQGVAACPVSCMHFVSFDELKELELVRDKGDGRDDHRHMNHRRGHTPLYVANIDSDNNHRSSWYHHLKNKCCTSGQCPQRGCFDCPSYKQSGENPYFKKKASEGQHVRAKHFIDNGDVDLWRKTADL